MKALRPFAVAAGGALAAHWSPAVAVVVPSAAGVRDTDHRRRQRSAADLRRRAASGRDAGDPHGARPRGRFGRLLRQRRAGRALPGARARDRGRGPRARPAWLPASDAAPVEPQAACRRHAPRPCGRIRRSRGRAAPLPASARGVQPRRAPADPRARARAALWSKWGRDWERGATSETITARVTAGLEAGDVILLHDADHYSARASWRATAAAIGPIADRIVAAGLQTASV